MKATVCLIVLLIIAPFFSVLAQPESVSGQVISESDQLPIPGVNVVFKGSTVGTVTNKEGRFNLRIPEGAKVLVFSFIGFQTQEIILGSQSTVDILMVPEIRELGEIVVTAQGLSREKASLGYGITTLSADEAINNRQETDLARLLRGKTTGVDITGTTGLAGSATNVIIRGYSSITGSNQPLFVVDGIPFNSDQNWEGLGWGSTASSRIFDVDPKNIQEVTILKGLAASVLYGENGRNGVVLITTKNGKGKASLNRKTEINFNQSIFMSEAANIPEYQNTYGNGFVEFGWFFSNWGPAFDDLRPEPYLSDFRGYSSDSTKVLITHPYDQPQYHDDLPEFIGAEYEYRPYKSVENFFNTGISSNSTISLKSHLGETGSLSASYSFLSEEGFTPRLEGLEDDRDGRTTYIDKHNMGIGMSGELQNGLKISGNFNYVDSEREFPITSPAGSDDANGLFAALMYTPRSMDLMGLPFQSPLDGSNVYYRRGSQIQNPRWTLNNSGQHETVRRFFSSIDLNFNLTEFLSASYRLSLDTYNQINQRRLNKGGSHIPDGELSTHTVKRNTVDHVFNLLYNFRWFESLSLNGVVGFNSRRETGDWITNYSWQQFVFDLFVHDNFIEHDSYSGISEKNVSGIYATATFSYKNWLYLGLQGRKDWASTLEKENRSLFYPSVSLSFIPTDLDFINIDAFDQLKVRIGYGTSAGYPHPYTTRTILETSTNRFVTKDGKILNTNSVSDHLGNPNLKPELHSEIELGVELSMYNNFIGLDLSLYRKISNDLLIDLPLDPATGYWSTMVNGAEVENKGIEAALNLNPRFGPFQWNNTFNFTRNINIVNDIIAGVDLVWADANVAIPGEPYGLHYGSKFQRNEDGYFVVDSQGQCIPDSENGIIGNPNPNYMMSWMTNLSWKGFSFGLLWEYVDGGDIYSTTAAVLMGRGNTIDTDVDRYIPLVMPNAVKQTGTDIEGNPVYVPNDIQTVIGASFFNSYIFAGEGYIIDGTVIRLREISLNYIIPNKLISNTPFENISISVSGENLWFNAPNVPRGTNYDPETNGWGIGNSRGIDWRTAPTAKKYGINLNLTF